MNPMCDFTVDESVLDVTFLHNYTMFAAAQRKYTYIYDSISGSEIHCLKEHARVTNIDFLPFHFLLVSWAENGIIRYLDTSTGQQVARHFSKMGPCHSLRQNQATSIVNVGHSDGCVSLWTPSIAEPVMKIRTHAA
jgi:U3 small nucleolar RNA-associated protein 7